MNNITITGRLCKEIEMKYTSGGNQTAFTRNTLAVDRIGKTKETDFINFVAFGKTAELIEKYVGKGCRMLVQGRLEIGSYEKDGTKRSTSTVVADRVEFIDFKEKQAEPEFENFSAMQEEIPF